MSDGHPFSGINCNAHPASHLTEHTVRWDGRLVLPCGKCLPSSDPPTLSICLLHSNQRGIGHFQMHAQRRTRRIQSPGRHDEDAGSGPMITRQPILADEARRAAGVAAYPGSATGLAAKWTPGTGQPYLRHFPIGNNVCGRRVVVEAAQFWVYRDDQHASVL
ncbi:hypothetical protein BO71DRAFT_436581 [Aspergillus ellipticus CBS 707.79]|uniref:Uncharacterized protein n=1 Tax=Aspergillus ellipticus CBS 707.79 TaxID=1448320 RepID=A0A319CSB0_9EURO|nr:hypothetical protein BO71DRAFT_436581 [Aspergillus ellipticus CBS 707.79]